MSWRKDAPVFFLRVEKPVPQQKEYIRRVAPFSSHNFRLLEEYVSAGESLWFNNYLRGVNMEELNASQKRILRNKTASLNKLIHDAPVSARKMVLFRGISPDATKFQKYRRGDDADFMNSGIVSTSVSYEAARQFIEDDDTCCMIIILIPAGTHMLEILDNFAWSEEKEVLLPHGSRFKAIKTHVVNGITTFYCVLTSQAHDV